MKNKKYLFNQIVVDGEKVKFIPYRRASLLESFMADTSTSFNSKDWEFYPFTFKQFLTMLSKTKLNDDYEYNISEHINYGDLMHDQSREIDFNTLLQSFAKIMYRDKVPDEDLLSKFYNMAYDVWGESKIHKSILEKDVEDFVK